MKTADSHLVRTTDLKLTVHGHGLAARRIEPPDLIVQDPPVLVFLHEGLGSMRLWGDFPHAIARGCGLPVLMYDRLGHGRSDPLPSAAVDTAYIDREAGLFLPQVLSACAVRRAILIGHSDGGTIALLYAAKHIGTAAGIVTEAAHVFVEDITRRGIRKTAGTYEKNLKPRLAKYHGDKVDTLFWRWADTWLSDAFAPWNIVARLNTVQCPVLAVQGEADEYGTADQVTAIAGHVGGRAETFLVPGCRHVPHYQARDVVAGRMIAFVQSLIASGDGPQKSSL